ncbi:MAG TPA: aminotransferase class V-fold PLP-dependent enzyme [Fimbriimonas sp.]|nr:aminotransferase class V-fold PLP-dependent enzyme [Fimbriimonas sp.]
MNPIVLAPGPTKVHPEMGQWLQEAVADGAVWQSHRSKWFFSLFDEVRDRLRTLLDIPSTHHIIFMNSSNEAWERAMQSCTANESFHMVGGEFAMRWHQYTGWLGRNAVKWAYDHTFDGDFGSVEVPDNAEAICVVNNETSIGLWIPEEQIHEIGRRYPDKLLMVDVVSAMPHCRLDWGLVDVAMFSVQKGFHSTAGLSVVVVSERAMQRSRELEQTQSIGSFHAFSRVNDFAQKSMTAETPNVLALYLLNKCVAKYQTIGLENIRAGITSRAEAFYEGLKSTTAKPMVTSERYKSPTLFAVNIQQEVDSVRAKWEQELGIYVGACYGDLKKHNFRVANFPMHTAEEHQALLKAIAALG